MAKCIPAPYCGGSKAVDIDYFIRLIKEVSDSTEVITVLVHVLKEFKLENIIEQTATKRIKDLREKKAQVIRDTETEINSIDEILEDLKRRINLLESNKRTLSEEHNKEIENLDNKIAEIEDALSVYYKVPPQA